MPNTALWTELEITVLAGVRLHLTMRPRADKQALRLARLLTATAFTHSGEHIQRLRQKYIEPAAQMEYRNVYLRQLECCINMRVQRTSKRLVKYLHYSRMMVINKWQVTRRNDLPPSNESS